jgi:hypothetical protein
MPTDTPPATRPPDVPYGRCWCGCGQKTREATRTNTALGVRKGEPVRFVDGHYNRTPAAPCDGDLATCPNRSCGLQIHPVGHRTCADRHPVQTSSRFCTACGRKRNVTPKMDPRVAAEEWDHFGCILGWTTTQFGEHFGYHTYEGIRGIFRELPADHPSRISFEAARRREVAATTTTTPGSFAAPWGSITGSTDRPGRPFAMSGRRVA